MTSRAEKSFDLNDGEEEASFKQYNKIMKSSVKQQ